VSPILHIGVHWLSQLEKRTTELAVNVCPPNVAFTVMVLALDDVTLVMVYVLPFEWAVTPLDADQLSAEGGI
jgi:hypothetical protein